MSKPYHRTHNPRMKKADILKTATAQGFHVGASRVVAHNVVRFTTEEKKPRTVCWYTHTPIVVFSPHKGEVVLRTGGYFTMRSAKHMNDEIRRIVNEEKLPVNHRFCVMSDRGKWYVDTNSSGRFRFFDGIHLRFESNRVHLVNWATGNRAVRHMDADNKRIERFCADAKARLLEHGPIQPAGNDCWRCMFIAFGEPELKNLKEQHRKGVETPIDRKAELLRRDYAHFIANPSGGHVKEKYLHGSLLACALRWADWEDGAIGYWYSLLQKDAREYDRERAANLIIHQLRRFLKHHAGLPHR
jgi:hypothetical protein